MAPTRLSFRLDVITVVVGLTIAIGAVIVCLQISDNLFKGDTTRVRALMATTSSLSKGSRVTMAGARVGRVVKVSRQGTGTLVELEITDDSVTPLPADTSIALRQRTPVGENYVELTPGRSEQPMAADAVIPIQRSGEYVDVDEILSVLQGRTRTSAQQLIQGLGQGLDGKGTQLNQTLGGASQVVRHGGSIFTQLDQDRTQLAQLFAGLGRVSAAVGERGAAVRSTADRGLVALRTVAGRDAALSEILDELPATLRQVRETSSTLRTTSQAAAPVVANLAGAVGDLGPAVQQLRPAAQQGREVVREVGLASKPLQTTLERLQDAAKPLSSALPAVRGAICQGAPVVRYARPYTDDAIATLVGLGSSANSYDAVGHLIRLSPILGENSLAGAPDEVTDAAHTLLRTGLLGQVSGGLTWNPYPKPGKIGNDGAGADGLSGPKALKASGYVFPHVEADC